MEYQKPEYSMSFDDDTSGQVLKGVENNLNDLTQKVLHSLNPAPTISDMPDTYVKLPAGLVINDEVIRDVEVQELTGQHEELLAKSKTANNAAKYVSTLLLCGVVSIGSHKVTQTILDSLIQGDLDTLMLGIRRATFGDDFEVFGVPCPDCGELNDMKMNLTDIPMQELEDPSVRDFLVDLKRGRKARIEYPTGKIQNEIFKKQISVPEINSLTLSSCVLSFISADGVEKPSNGLADVKNLGAGDRKTLIDFIYETQPGPRYDKVVAKCSSCEGEVPVPLNVGILFREL